MVQTKKPSVRGRRVSKAKILKGKYAAELEFSEGWNGSNQKTIIFSMCGLYVWSLLLYT